MSVSVRKLLILLLVVAGIYIAIDMQKGSYKGPLNLEDPMQSEVVGATNIVLSAGENTYTIHFLAEYEIQAAVKHIKKYRTDTTAEISPVDFALVWGSLVDSNVDEHIRYSQKGRWYYWHYDGDGDVSMEYISQHSANVHMIPANDDIEDELMKIKKEEFVHLKGYLVEVILPGGTWKSSLSRTDTGDGACEIFYVNEITSPN